MEEKLTNLDEFNIPEQELFSHIDHDMLASEKITAPRYSYWRSVFRVFFKKKINVVILSILAVLIIFTYVYPAIIGYDAVQHHGQSVLQQVWKMYLWYSAE